MDKYSILKDYFGHSQFRQGQEALIDAILAGRDTLGVMPTGGGKSLCYQVPALLLPGVTLVISPLISLMKDQVTALTEAGVSAAYINSSLSVEEFREVYAGARRGVYKLLYIAPERLEAEGFLELLRSLEVSLVAVDEAHCISQWGQDFRPSYLKITEFIASLPRRPVVAAFTATATAEVRHDIVRLLGQIEPFSVVTGFDRPNLFFDVRRPKRKLATLLALLKERKGQSGIIYCATRANVEKVCQALCDEGFAATRYHAGLDEAERRENQDDFQFDRKTIMVATNAFGMGIDKSNVSFVIHYQMPKSVEAYYQEAGRAGRDGEAADCILLFSPGDVETGRYLIENSGNEAVSPEEQELLRQRDYQRLNTMAAYCKTTKCLRGYLLDYFGQEHGEKCGNCGNCREVFQNEDITVPAQMILSCVVRMREHLGYGVGKGLVIQTLRGSKNQRLVDLGLDRLSTYGLMDKLSQDQVRAYVDYLEGEGYLWVNPAHSTVEVTQKARGVLFGKEQLSMPVRVEVQEEILPEKKKKRRASQADSPLMGVLKAVRTRIAQEEHIPPYMVFSNATLADMEEKMPRNLVEFLDVNGVGQVKAERYGEAFLEALWGER